MTEIKVKWTKENVWEFVKFNSLRRNKTVKVTFIALTCCFGLILGVCLTSFFALNNFTMLIAAIVLTVLVAGYVFMFYRMLKGYAKKIYAANSNDEDTTVRITDELILVLKNNVPVGKLSWQNLSAIYFNDEKDAAYIMTKESALLLVEYTNIIEGTKEELKKLLEAKDAELSKKA